MAWLLTFPMAAAIGAGSYGLCALFGADTAGPVVVALLALAASTLVFLRRARGPAPAAA